MAPNKTISFFRKIVFKRLLLLTYQKHGNFGKIVLNFTIPMTLKSNTEDPRYANIN